MSNLDNENVNIELNEYDHRSINYTEKVLADSNMRRSEDQLSNPYQSSKKRNDKKTDKFINVKSV